MLIEIYSDTVCPWCYIGKRRLEKALAQRPDIPVEIRWRAFQLNPWMPAEGVDRKEYLRAKFGSDDAGDTYRRISQVGAGEDIAFAFGDIPRTPNTLASHQLVHAAQEAGVGDDVVERLFQAYFLNGQDIGDAAVLADIARAAGVPPDAERISLDAVQDEDATARRMGIQGVPCFIIDKRYAVSGAQEAEYFLPVFDLVANGEAA